MVVKEYWAIYKKKRKIRALLHLLNHVKMRNILKSLFNIQFILVHETLENYFC